MTERAPAGHGQITPRMVDLFHASVPSIRRTGIAGLTAGVATLAACLLASGALWPKIAAAPALRTVLWTLGCVGGLAFLNGLGLLELAKAYARIPRGSGDCAPAVEKALRALRLVWLLACVLALVAVRAVLTLSSGAVGSFEPSPSLPDPFGNLRSPRSDTLLAKRTPVWVPPPAEVSLGGRALGWDDLPTACAIEAPEFFCLLNQEGETLPGDARRKVRREVTMEIKQVEIKQVSGTEPRFKVQVRSGVAGISLATPQGVPYSPLLYTGATGQIEDFAHPYLATSESVQSGRFRILEVETGPDGLPARLVVDFELTHPDGWVETGRFSARVHPSEP